MGVLQGASRADVANRPVFYRSCALRCKRGALQTSGDYEAGLHVKKKALPLRHENRVRWSGWHRTLGLPESTIRDHPHRGVARVDAGAGRTSFTRGQRSVERSRSQTSAITAPGQPRDQTIMWTFEAGPLGNAPKKCSRYSVAAAITRLRFSSKYGSYTEPSRHIA